MADASPYPFEFWLQCERHLQLPRSVLTIERIESMAQKFNCDNPMPSVPERRMISRLKMALNIWSKTCRSKGKPNAYCQKIQSYRASVTNRQYEDLDNAVFECFKRDLEEASYFLKSDDAEN